MMRCREEIRTYHLHGDERMRYVLSHDSWLLAQIITKFPALAYMIACLLAVGEVSGSMPFIEVKVVLTVALFSFNQKMYTNLEVAYFFSW